MRVPSFSPRGSRGEAAEGDQRKKKYAGPKQTPKGPLREVTIEVMGVLEIYMGGRYVREWVYQVSARKDHGKGLHTKEKIRRP